MNTNLSAEIRLWHPTDTVLDLKQALGQEPVIAHQAGAKRQPGAGTYDRTSCVFEVTQRGLFDFGQLVTQAASVVQKLKAARPSFFTTGGSCYIVIAFFDPEVLHFDLRVEMLKTIVGQNCNLVIENHCPPIS